MVCPGQVDILNVSEGKELPRYDRPLTVEVWYPAAAGATGSTEYNDVLLRDGATKVSLQGRAMRDASPDKQGAPFPLVIISHGYPGNRFLLSPLAENLASKGYVVASIDHKDSTYDDKTAFGSTLVNRPLDQLFVLNEMARLSADGASPLAGMVDAGRTGLVGYSMGGYGAVITAGGGVTDTGIGYSWGAPAGTLAIHKAGSESLLKRFDPRIKAVIAFAPWGRNLEFWNADTLKDMKIPTLFVAGSVDDVSGYENGTRKMFTEATGVERYLLTFDNANHNAGAPMPPPAESWKPSPALDFLPYDHYADPVWDNVRMNNIAQHFATAFLGAYVLGDEAKKPYLDLVANANDGVVALDEAGKPKPEHTQWKGFAPRTAKGLRFERLAKGQ